MSQNSVPHTKNIICTHKTSLKITKQNLMSQKIYSHHYSQHKPCAQLHKY